MVFVAIDALCRPTLRLCDYTGGWEAIKVGNSLSGLRLYGMGTRVFPDRHIDPLDIYTVWVPPRRESSGPSFEPTLTPALILTISAS